MKKGILVIAALLTASAFFTSCNKDYECVCTLNGTETNRYSVRATTKNGAEDECNQKQSSLGMTYQCKID